jgi:hypothetical protein
MDNVSWGVLALVLTGGSGAMTWYAIRNRGARSAVRWSGVTLLPIALYLTHTLRLLGRIGTAIGDWATGFVFNPFVWVGVAMGVVGIALVLLAGRIPSQEDPEVTGGGRKQVGAAKPRSSSPFQDDDFADVADILKKHGIS